MKKTYRLNWEQPRNKRTVIGLIFAAAGFVDLGQKKPVWGILFRGIWGIACILLCCSAPTWMVADASFLDVGWYRVAIVAV